jgi:23S rRNA (guanosine2251-2'-O)-methyltransferase
LDRRRVAKRPRPGPARPHRPPLDLDDAIYGVHAVEEALLGGETLRKLHVGDERRRDPALRRVLALAAEQKVTVRFEPRAFFAQFPYKAHQSVVAFGAPFEYAGLEEAIARGREAGRTLIVVLDHITDPHNVGAILRTADGAGAQAVVLPERRSAGINATVRKASAGAASHVPVVRVANIAAALRTLKKAGVWIAGASADDAATPYAKADFDRDLALVIGAEGTGLSQVARKECDFLVRIPLRGRVPSLNASVAAGILLYEAVRSRPALG